VWAISAVLDASPQWVPNQNMEHYLREFGRPPTEPVAVIIGEAEVGEVDRNFLAFLTGV